MSSDYTKVWEVLCSSHVLLMVDTVLDMNGAYNIDVFNSKVDDITAWFSPIIKTRAGTTDLEMKNGAWLFIRPLVPFPFKPNKNLKVLVIT